MEEKARQSGKEPGVAGVVLFVGGKEKYINTTLLRYGCDGGFQCMCSIRPLSSAGILLSQVRGAGSRTWPDKRKTMVHYNLYV